MGKFTDIYISEFKVTLSFYGLSSIYNTIKTAPQPGPFWIHYHASPLGSSKVDSAFLSPRSTKLVPSIPGDLVVKSKFSPRSDSAALRQLNPN